MGVKFKFDLDRAVATVAYIASKFPTGADSYKMCKLVFLSDKLHLVRFGRPITGDDIRAMNYGPVPSAVYDMLKGAINGEPNERVRLLGEHLVVSKNYQYPRFQLENPVAFEESLSLSEIAAIDEVVAIHGNKTFDELYQLTHALPAYTKVWDDKERSSQNPLMSFEDLFTNDLDAIADAKDEMLEDFEIRRSMHASV